MFDKHERVQVLNTPNLQCPHCLTVISLGGKPLSQDGEVYVGGLHGYHPKCQYSDRKYSIKVPMMTVLVEVPAIPDGSCALCDGGSEVIDGWHYTRVGGMIFPTNRRCTKVSDGGPG